MSLTPVIASNGNIAADCKIKGTLHNTGPQEVKPGEILQTTVLSKSADNKYLLALKNMHIQATSHVPLQTGETIIVRVDSLQPEMVLNFIERKNGDNPTGIHENMRKWRANPGSLLKVIEKAANLAMLFPRGEMPAKLFKTDIDKLIKLFDSITFSSRTKSNPFFLKEFMTKTGLLLESSLRQLVLESTKGKIDKLQEENLKVLLLKISSEVREMLRENAGMEQEIISKLIHLAEFTHEALKEIEIKQTINSAFQDRDNGLILQVPVAVADKFCLADIFITPGGKDERGQKSFSSCLVTIFLDLDYLGRLMINVSTRDGQCNCIIKCEKEEVRELIDHNIEKLKTSLADTGYQTGYLECIRDEQILGAREEFIASQSLGLNDLVNYFA